MQLVKTLSFGLLATLLWNCNDATEPEAISVKDVRVPATINALVKTAAVNAGLVAIEPPTNEETLPFSTSALATLKSAGLCQGFIDLFEEISSTDQNFESGSFTPRLQEVVTCFTKKIIEDSTLVETNFMSVVDECFCKGTGTLFGSFAFNLAKYAPPEIGGGYSRPVTSPAPYSAPVSTGAPYSAPSTPAGEGYSAPGL
jgi:hypothetical protein